MNLKCPVCAFPEESIEWLHVHCVLRHPKEFVTCPWCTMPFASLRSLQNHTKECPALDKNEPREGKIKSSFVNDAQCLKCEGRFDSHETAIKHYKEQHLNFSYICDVCTMYFQQNANLDKHYAESHPKESTSADVSTSSATLVATRSKNQLKRSATVAVGENASSAKAVSRPGPAFTRKKSVIANLSMREKMMFMKHFNLKKCYQCEIEFNTTPEIAQHFRIDHLAETYVCEECNNAYLSAHSRYKHKRAKHAEKRSPSRVHGTKRNVGSAAWRTMRIDTDASAQSATEDEILKCPHPQCGFQETSRDVYLAHVSAPHIEADIKSEDGNEVGSTSAIFPRVVIKSEPSDESPSTRRRQRREESRAIVPIEMCDQIVDLISSDEDE